MYKDGRISVNYKTDLGFDLDEDNPTKLRQPLDVFELYCSRT